MITVHFWSNQLWIAEATAQWGGVADAAHNIMADLHARTAVAVAGGYTIPYRIVTAEMAEAEAAAAPDEWHWMHSFGEGFGWTNPHRRQTVMQADLSRLRNYIVARNMPGIDIEFASPTAEQLVHYHELIAMMDRAQALLRAARELANPTPPPRFDTITLPRVANRPQLPDLRAILAANPLRIEP